MTYRLPALLGIVCLTVCQPAAALDALEADTLKLYGGVYATDCASPAAPHLRVADTLNVEYGNQRMTGGGLVAAYSYFGQEPPKNFQVALLSQLRGGASLVFHVYRDARGLYIELEGDPKVETALTAVLGKAQFKAKYRDCDAARRAPDPIAVPAAPTRAAAGTDDVANWDYLGDKTFRARYRKALGAKANTPWIAQLNGPAPAARMETVADTAYRYVAVCKPHDCHDHSLVLLYSPEQRVVVGTIHEPGRSTLFGKPSAEVAASLERLWKAEWRAQGN
jgi:hypothetical protein